MVAKYRCATPGSMRQQSQTLPGLELDSLLLLLLDLLLELLLEPPLELLLLSVGQHSHPGLKRIALGLNRGRLG